MSSPAHAGVIVTQNVSPGATNWPGVPLISTVTNPASTSVGESFNGAGGNTNLSETFTVGSTNYLLQTIDLYVSGGTGTGAGSNLVLKLFDLGAQTAPNPSNYTAAISGGNLLGSGAGLPISYYGQANGILQLDFTGADQVLLQAGHMYAFELTGTSNTTVMFWQRVISDTYAGGAAFRNQSWINGNNARDFALAVYASSASYTIPIVAGYNLIANQLDHGSNTLNEIMPTVPNGCALYKYNSGNGTWSVYGYAAGSWANGNSITLIPGEGAFLQSPSSFSLTFKGHPHVPVLPVTLSAGWNLISRQTNDIGNYANIVGTVPPDFTTILQWNENSGGYYSPVFAVDGLWYDESFSQEVFPMARVGEAVFICTSGCGSFSATPQITCSTNKTVECGTNWTFDPPTVSGSCSGGNVIITVQSTVTNIGSSSNVITRTWQVTDACTNAATCSQTVTVENIIPPVITLQPLSLVVTQGSSATFTVTATGAGPLTYQWRADVTDDIPGAIGASLTITNAMAADTSEYEVIISGPCGSVTSAPTFLFVVDDDPCAEGEREQLDANGAVIPSVDEDTGTPPEEQVVVGEEKSVKDLYPGLDMTTDLWYPQINCNRTFGGEIDPEDTEPEDLGGYTEEEVREKLRDWNNKIADKARQEPNALTNAPPVTGLYTFPITPHCPTNPTNAYVFGGRDIVFVHGFQTATILGEAAGHLLSKWQLPTNFPANLQNPEFYTGDWKDRADKYWTNHIQRFLQSKGMKNRYLIVAWPSTERLEVGVQAVLTQIGDAMRSGIGVVDLSGNNDTNGFGTPSFVVVSHSTGGPLTDVALSSAANNTNLQAEFIPKLCKAHIALHGAFSGCDIATAAVAVSHYVETIPFDQIFPIACFLLEQTIFKEDPNFDCNFMSGVKNSVLVDLTSSVMQTNWGAIINATPVRTLTVIGGHPSSSGSIVKSLLLAGFDDGVLNLNSQVANPNPEEKGPSGFESLHPLYETKDMGINDYSGLLPKKKRSKGYFRDQTHDQSDGQFVASGAIPYISPTGMWQPTNHPWGDGYDPLARYHYHYSFLQSASDHFGGTPSFDADPDPGYLGFPGTDGQQYEVTKLPVVPLPESLPEINEEETQVITDTNVYAPYVIVPFPTDNQPLLKTNFMPRVMTTPVEKVRWSLHLSKPRWRPKTKWHRDYSRLEGWQTLTECDYVYKYVLSGPVCPTASATLSISYPRDVLSTTVVDLNWTPPGWILQRADSVTGPWTNLFTTSNSFTTPITGPKMFYRLKLGP